MGVILCLLLKFCIEIELFLTLRACQFPDLVSNLKINLFKTFSCD